MSEVDTEEGKSVKILREIGRQIEEEREREKRREEKRREEKRREEKKQDMKRERTGVRERSKENRWWRLT